MHPGYCSCCTNLRTSFDMQNQMQNDLFQSTVDPQMKIFQQHMHNFNQIEIPNRNTFGLVDFNFGFQKKKRRVYKTEESNVVLQGFKFRYEAIPNAKYNRKLIVCEYPGCNKTFNKTWNFRDHALMHEGIKPFSCEICGKTFTQKGNKKKHMKAHMNTKYH